MLLINLEKEGESSTYNEDSNLQPNLFSSANVLVVFQILPPRNLEADNPKIDQLHIRLPVAELNIAPARCSYGCEKRYKFEGAMSGLYSGCGKISHSSPYRVLSYLSNG